MGNTGIVTKRKTAISHTIIILLCILLKSRTFAETIVVPPTTTAPPLTTKAAPTTSTAAPTTTTAAPTTSTAAPTTTTAAPITTTAAPTTTTAAPTTTTAAPTTTTAAPTTTTAAPTTTSAAPTTTTAAPTEIVPDPPDDVHITNIIENSFNVQWSNNAGKSYTNLSIVVSPVTSGISFNPKCKHYSEGNCTLARDENTLVNVTGLVSGTYYTVKVYGIVNGTLGHNYTEVTTNTVPDPPDDVHITNIIENSFNVQWSNNASKSYTNLSIVVSPATTGISFNPECKHQSEGNCTLARDKSTSVNFTGLVSGTYYNVKVYSIVNGTLSHNYFQVTTYTVPDPPDDVHITNIIENSFNVQWSNNASKSYTNLSIVVSPATTGISFNPECKHQSEGNCTLARDKSTSVNVTGLVSGTYYNVKVYSIVNGTLSHNYFQVTTYTVPDPPDDVHITNIIENSFNVQWSNNASKSYTNLSIVVSPATTGISFNPECKHQSEGNCTLARDKSTSVNVTGLVSGTYYTVKVYSIVNGTLSHNYSKVTINTVPDPPDKASLNDINNNSFIVEWTDNVSKVYTHLSIVVSPATTNISFDPKCTNSNIGNCTLSRQTPASVSVMGLVSGTYYTVKVYSIVNGTLSHKYAETSTNTVPDPPDDVLIRNISENSFNVHWSNNVSKVYTHLSIVLSPATTNISFDPKCTNINIGNCTLSRQALASVGVMGLVSGTYYTVKVYSIVNGTLSNDYAETSTYTAPSGFKNGRVENITETAFTIYLDNMQSNYTDVSFIIKPPPQRDDICSNGNCTFEKNINNSFWISPLQPGMNYNITVYTMIGGLLTKNPLFLTSFTKPSGAQNGVVDNITENGFTISWENGSSTYTDVSIVIYPSPEGNDICRDGNCTFRRNSNNTFWAGGLKTGTQYQIYIYTMIGGLQTDTPFNFSSYTRPGSVKTVKVKNRTASSISLEWEAPDGEVAYYIVESFCLSPNNGSTMKENNAANVTETSVKIIELDPGTHCNVSIMTNVGYLKGQTQTFNIPKTTLETGPGQVAILAIKEKTSRSISVTWQKPYTSNGVIRKYRLRIIDTYKNECLKEETIFRTNYDGKEEDNYFCSDQDATEIKMSNCTNFINGTDSDWTGADKVSYTAQSLHPFRNYSVSIQAFTRCWGNQSNSITETDEDVPAAAPKATALKSNITATSVTIAWDRLNEEDQNGIITEYTLFYDYINNSCYDRSDGIYTYVKISNISSSTYNKTIPDLRPYWQYNFYISASTKKGNGTRSNCSEQMCNVRTLESLPGEIDISSLNITTASTTVNVTWKGPPCKANGIIKSYTYSIQNRDDESNNFQTDTNINFTYFLVEKLLPYRNYSIKIAANTSVGQGDFTGGVNFTTRIDIPNRPNTPNATAVYNSSCLAVSWQKLPQIYYTGPTWYKVTANVSKAELDSRKCETSGYNSTTCDICALHPFWVYNITVTANTTAGIAISYPSSARTSEDKPGKVREINVTAEKNVTLQRSITVAWMQPAELDLNGEIKNYTIVFKNTNYNNEILKNTTKDNQTTIFRQDNHIKTGTYNVTIYATTSAGPGSEVSKTVYVPPGAPILPPSDSKNPLIMSGGDVPDKTNQISVQLALTRWLCNTTNGNPVEWGIVVAQSDQANDLPFNGEKAEFNNTRRSAYKKWFEVKDKDSIPRYIATLPNWAPCRTKSGENDTYFVVGESGECKNAKDNMQGYCNGQLPSGRSYRVKTFVCTDGGCTESEYSEQISTDPDLTAPIAAGLSSVVIVLAVIAVVIVYLKRRQRACFAKDVGGTRNEDDENDMPMDKIERPNAFKPGAVKLSEFPAYVEKMHRDSDLLFADAYKLLRDNSPKHPMLAAEQQCSRPKNRYTDILPFDHSRVKILPTEDVEGSDYINANYIPGYVSPREYIAAQGPMTATFEDFWRMVWEQNVDTIVMLTKLIEKGRRKCDQYWPELSEPQFYGDLVVNLQSESNMSDYVIRIFEVKLKDMKKTVRHFSYLKWPDMGCPETPELLLEFVKAVRQYTNREHASKAHGPMVVHCSAGVGRTGTFIAVDILLQHVVDHDEVDIYNLVLKLRNHRLRMIQTEDQYVYTHECIKAFITTDENEEEEHLYENYPVANAQEEENAYENTAFSKEPEK